MSQFALSRTMHQGENNTLMIFNGYDSPGAGYAS